jgi:acetyl-CoA synthetase (ADP-forming)
VPTLSEAASKALLATHGVPVPGERTAATVDGAVEAAEQMGYPVVLKLCGDRIAHKTERGLVRLQLADRAAVEIAAGELLSAAQPSDGDVELLVAPMLRANRELIAGVHRDPQFGPCVMVGIGGVLAEALGDVAFRLVPITPTDAEEMIDDLAMRELLEPFRGEPAVDRVELAKILLGLSETARTEPRIESIDLNPLLVVDGRPIAVDALVELAD